MCQGVVVPYKDIEKRREASRKCRAKPETKEKNKAYREANKERIKKLKKEWSIKNKERANATKKQWAENNKERNASNKLNWFKNKMKNDPLYAIKHRMRKLIKETLKRNNFIKPSKTELILGCSFQFFKDHLESYFKHWPGMGWHNMTEWHVDHIVPTSTATTIDEAIKLNNYKNLQPLWKDDNFLKKDSLDWSPEKSKHIYVANPL